MFFRKEKDISTPKFSLCNADMSFKIHILAGRWITLLILPVIS